MLTRRSFICTAPAVLTPNVLVAMPFRQNPDRIPSLDEVPSGHYPGDFAYKHSVFHDEYMQVFEGHCKCGVGECRVSDWRTTQLGSQRGYDIIVSRRWWPLPADVWIPPPDKIPAALRRDRAHICAYGDTGMHERNFSPSIPCAIINVMEI